MQDAVTPPTTLGMFVRPNRRLPGSMRSGEKARKNSWPTVSPAAAKRGSSTSSVVPGYVVDSSTMSWPARRMRATSSVAATMWEMSGSLDFPSGVGTQMMMASAAVSAAIPSATTRRRAVTRGASSSLGTSSTGLTPARMRADAGHSDHGQARLGEGHGQGQADVTEPDDADGGVPPLQPLLELLRHLPPGRAQWSRPSASRMARDVASISASV